MPSTTKSQPTSDVHSFLGKKGSARGDRSRVIYVSYDGIEEPLGRSQVLAYLVRLSASYDISLVSFEKSPDPPAALRREVEAAGIDWIPLRYHRRPPVLSTLVDVRAGRRAVTHAAHRGFPAVVHVRSYVPALMAVLARRGAKAKLLFDIRGFWADERVEGGIWRPGGVLYRIAKRCERRFFAEADAVVTLTSASVAQIRAWTDERQVPIDVIPTCVDVDRFSGSPRRPGGSHAVWLGSLGTWYRFDLTARIVAALSLPLTVITCQPELACELLDGFPASLRSVAPDDIPGELFAGDIGLCLIASTFSKIASAPTRFAEYLAAGMPVLVTPGVGDLESIVQDYGVGAVLRGEDQSSVLAAAATIRALAQDPEVSERCRRVARQLFDVDAGSRKYGAIYARLAGGAG